MTSPLRILLVDSSDECYLQLSALLGDSERYRLSLLPLALAGEVIEAGECDIVLVTESHSGHDGVASLRDCATRKSAVLPMLYCISEIDKRMIDEALAAGATGVLRTTDLDMEQFASTLTHAVDVAGKCLRIDRMLRTIIDLVPGMIQVNDREGDFLLANRATAAFYGAGVNELIGSNLSNWHLDPDELRVLKQQHLNIIDHGASVIAEEKQLTSRDGVHHIVETTSVPLLFPDREEQAVLSFSREVTEERRAHRSQAHVFAALEAAGDAVVITALDATIEYVNPAFEAMTGYSMDEVVGRNPSILKSGVHDQSFYIEMWKILLGGETFRGTLTNRRKDGRLFDVEETITPVFEDGYIVGFVAFERDVTEKRVAEDALRASEERFALAAEGANDGLWDWDCENDALYLSPRIYEMIGRDPENGIASVAEFNTLLPEDQREELQKRVNRHLRGLTEYLKHEFQVTMPDGSGRWLQMHGVARRNASGQAIRVAGSLTDISSFKRNEAEMLAQSLRDDLTGLPNRKMFINHIASAVHAAEAHDDYRAAVLYIGMVRIRELRSSMGETQSDRLISKVARRLRECIRPNDVLAHIHVGEFALLLPQVKDVEAAKEMALRIKKTLRDSFREEQRMIRVGTCIGITMIDRDASRVPEYILRDAALAEAAAKEQTRDYQLFDPQMYEAALNRLHMEGELDVALAESQFRLYLQPIMNLQAGGLSGFEGLIRWIHPERGMVPPDQFIPVAEETGQIVEIGKWVLGEVHRRLIEWHEAGAPFDKLYISVNLSPLQLRESATLRLINRLLSHAPYAPSQMRMEITESAILDDAEQTRSVLELLKEYGTDLYLDDFGTGYSWLSYLHSFPFDVLKVDQSFVREIEHDATKRRIVESIIQLATHLNMRVVAEGVETEAHMNLLKGMGCHKAQGYLFSRPLPPNEVNSFIEQSFGIR